MGSRSDIAEAFAAVALVAAAAGAQVPDVLAALPLAFVENRGQWETGTNWRVIGVDGVCEVGALGVTLDLPGPDGAGRRIGIRIAGADPAARIERGPPLPGRFHFLRGRDPSRWVRGLEPAASLVIRGVRPGIDVEYGGVTGRLKGTWTLAPGASPADVSWSYTDAGGVRIVSDGAIEILDAESPCGPPLLRESAPVAWQDAGGRRLPVECRYVLREDGFVGFATGPSDPALPLVIDPEIVWATFLGGSGTDLVFGMDDDGRGCVYVTGYVHSRHSPEPFPLHAPPGAAPLQAYYGGEIGDAFVTKIRHDVTPPRIVYSTRLGGGRSLECAQELAWRDPLPAASRCDVQPFPGSITWSACPTCPAILPRFVWFPDPAAPPPAAWYPYPTPHPGDPRGMTALRPLGTDRGFGIAVDRATGEAVVVGRTQSDDFPGTGSPSLPNLARVRARNPSHQPVIGSDWRGGPAPGDHADTHDAFIARLSADGSELVFSTYWGGPLEEDAKDVALDRDGNAYVVGFAKSDAGSALDLSSCRGPMGRPSGAPGSWDGFLLKFDPAGRLQGGTWIGGADHDFATGVCVGPDPLAPALEKVYVTGSTRSADFMAGAVRLPPGCEVLQPGWGGCSAPAVEPFVQFGIGDVAWYGDAFVLAFDTRLETCGYATFLDSRQLCLLRTGSPAHCPPAPTNEWAEKIAVDDAGSLYVTGVVGPAPFAASFLVRLATRGLGAADLLGVTALAGEYRVHAYDVDVGEDEVWLCGFVQHDPVSGGALPVLRPLRGAFIRDAAGLRRDDEPKPFDLSRFQLPGAGGTIPSLADGFVASFDRETLAPRFVSYVGGEGNEFLHRIRVVDGGSVVAAGIAGRPSSRAPRLHPIFQAGLGNAREIDPRGAFGARHVYQGGRYPTQGQAEAYLLKIRDALAGR